MLSQSSDHNLSFVVARRMVSFSFLSKSSRLIPGMVFCARYALATYSRQEIGNFSLDGGAGLEVACDGEDCTVLGKLSES